MKSKLSAISLVLFYFSLTSIFAQPVQWQEVHPGVWKGIVGKPDTYDLLKAADVKPSPTLQTLPKADFPLNNADISVEVKNGKTYLRFPLQRNEQLYGFGLNFQTVHQRGRIMQLHADHYGKSDNGRTHAPVPFYLSRLAMAFL